MARGLIFAFLLSGCSTITWSDKCGQIHRTGIGSDVYTGNVTIETTPDCAVKVTIESFSSDQSQAIKAAVQGAVEGAVKGMKP